LKGFGLKISYFFFPQGYRDQILSEEMASIVPDGLREKEDLLFGNLHELYTFHSEVFLKDLENCISTTELVALCFVQRVSGQVCGVHRKTSSFNSFFTEGHLLPALLVLLPEHPSI
jgi:hypothetical protein